MAASVVQDALQAHPLPQSSGQQSGGLHGLFRLKKRSTAVGASIQLADEQESVGVSDDDPDFKLHLGPSLVIILLSNFLLQVRNPELLSRVQH